MICRKGNLNTNPNIVTVSVLYESRSYHRIYLRSDYLSYSNIKTNLRIKTVTASLHQHHGEYSHSVLVHVGNELA